MTVVIISISIAINLCGASETGAVGNIITMFKILVLMALVLAGLIVMFGGDANWIINFQNPAPSGSSFEVGLFPTSLGGIILAMGLTFVAFEGHEIISQSCEELVNPERNLPRAIFYSIGITVVYIRLSRIRIHWRVGSRFGPAKLVIFGAAGRKGDDSNCRIYISLRRRRVSADIGKLGFNHICH